MRRFESGPIQIYSAGPKNNNKLEEGEPTVFLHNHGLQTGRHPHSITIGTTRGHNATAPYRVPRRIRPLYRTFRHGPVTVRTGRVLKTSNATIPIYSGGSR